jgi:L-alanine-DL-glutamate epimerase-like enolase superfamily enzyme
MAGTDIRVTDTAVGFRDVALDPPLTLSGGSIARFTVAEVDVEVVSRDGRSARGHGESVLSVPWAWPRSGLSVDDRDAVLRRLVERYARDASALAAADPIAMWRRLVAGIEAVLDSAAGNERVPKLAGLLAVGAVDNALHDAWGRAAGRSTFEMYTADHLASDLGSLGLPGRHPGDGVDPAGAGRLPVQHVVGVSDALHPAPGARSLADWITTEGVSRLKIKVAGADPAADARRVHEVYRTARDLGVSPRLAVDPNEGYADPGAALAMLDELTAAAPEALAALDYLEQPVPRGTGVDPTQLARLSRRVPTLMDEGFTSLARLGRLRADGWSGVVIKAGKGQTPAVVAAAAAHRLGLWAVVQDLTATGPAFVHSARLASCLRTTRRHLEYNSRQYVPAGNDDLRRELPRLANVVDGHVALDGLDGMGLYGV